MTGFFDLPLELRQRIYEEMLPDDRMVTLDRRRHSSTYARKHDILPKESSGMSCERQGTILAARKADKRLWKELTHWVNKRCGLRIVIKPGSPPPPASIKYGTIRRLEVYIDYYKPAAEFNLLGHPADLSDTYSRLDNRKNLKALRDNIALLTTMLAKYPNLRRLWVEFRDEPYEEGFGDDHWCRRVPDIVSSFDGEVLRRGSVLDEMETGDMPVVEYLLRPLLRLPVCEMAFICGPDNVVALAGVNEGKFDWEYLQGLKTTLGLWLTGQRSVPFDEYWRSFGDGSGLLGRLWHEERRQGLRWPFGHFIGSKYRLCNSFYAAL